MRIKPFSLEDRYKVYLDCYEYMLTADSRYLTGLCYLLRHRTLERLGKNGVYPFRNENGNITNGPGSSELIKFFPELKRVKPWYVGIFRNVNSYWWKMEGKADDQVIRIKKLDKMITMVEKKIDKERVRNNQMIAG